MAELEITVERCREGDEDAWSALVSTTLRPIYRLCASYAPSAAEAEELTQEVYFKLWENLHRYRPGSNFMAWAWRVAKNLIIDSYRRSRREREAAWLDPEVIDHLPSSDDPHEQTNLAGDAGSDLVLTELRSRLDAHMVATADPYLERSFQIAAE